MFAVPVFDQITARFLGFRFLISPSFRRLLFRRHSVVAIEIIHRPYGCANECEPNRSQDAEK